MTAKTKTYELTPEDLQAKKLEIEYQLIAYQKEKRKVKRMVAWKITKTILTPIVLLFGFIGLIIFGSLFAILSESFKKIYK